MSVICLIENHVSGVKIEMGLSVEVSPQEQDKCGLNRIAMLNSNVKKYV